MRIISLELKHFLRHEHFRRDFAAGTNIIRGANEDGKSSALEGWGYNWFGTAMLTGTLDETVYDLRKLDAAADYAPKKSALWTKTVFEANDAVVYECERSVAGAELRVLGQTTPMVTGHKEVTAKIEQLLGIPPGKAAYTMFANQNQLRGVLSLGPTAAAEFVEKLADFSEIDKVLKTLESKLDLGDTKPLKEQLDAVKEALIELDKQAVEVGPVDELESERGRLERGIATTQPMAEASAKALIVAETENRVIGDRRAKLSQEKTLLEGGEKLQTEKRRKLQAAVDAIEPAKSAVEAINLQAAKQQRWQSFLTFSTLPNSDTVIWEGDLASFQSALTEARQTMQDHKEKAAALHAESVAMQGRMLTTTQCPLGLGVCKQAENSPERVAVVNQELQEKIGRLDEQRAGFAALAAEDQQYVKDLETIQIHTATIESWLQHHEQFVQVDRTHLPPKVTWQGEEPEETKPADQQEALRLNQVIAAGELAARELLTLPVVNRDRLVEVENELKSLPAEKDVAELRTAAGQDQQRLFELQQQLRSVEEELAGIEKAEEVRAAVRKQKQEELDRLNARITTMATDNELYKAAKAARVQTLNVLWGQIMSGVSAYFSKFRGRQTVVTRENNSFLIDGRKTRLSGSTEDILGLSLRLAILKVFSNCGIMVLDEPGAGCDARRSATMLGTLSAAGLDQVIYVTHNAPDEAAGANLIQLGETA